MPPTTNKAAGDERVLILAPIGRDAAAAQQLLTDASLASLLCPTLEALCSALSEGHGGAAIIAEEAFARGVQVLGSWVEAQPPWSDFPFILLSHQAARRDSGPHRLLLLKTLRNVTLLERPVHAVTLVAAAQTALRARRRQYDAAIYLREREQVAERLEELVALRTELLEAANSKLREEIFDKKAAQQALERAQESLTIALEAAQMGTIDLDLVSDVARRSLRHDLIYGYTELQPTWGRAVMRRHIIPEDQPVFDRAFERALATDKLQLECRVQWPDGTIHWIVVEGRLYRSSIGLPLRLAGVIADATERRTVEENLRQASKLEAVGQLTAGVAHDFNNLLTAVLGNIELATTRVSDHKVRRLLAGAESAAHRGAELTQQLLAFARRQNLAPKAVDINSLVSGMGDLLFRTIGATVRIETVLEKDLWAALIDPTQLELVILNLALNGRDAMPNGGRLTIATRNVRIDQRQHKDLEPGVYVAVSVSDTGTGMTDAVLAKAFEPFYTTKGLGKGTGLGLSQAYGVARQSGGTVAIETEAGAGSTVTIYLPVTTATVEDMAPPAATPRRDRDMAAAVILVVDDDADVRDITVTSLNELGYTVLEADSGEAALEVIAGRADIDLVLLDFVMPGMGGGEAADRIRELRPGLRALFMSGYADDTALKRHIARDGLLRKPFKISDLAGRVATALAKRSETTASSNVVEMRSGNLYP